MKLMFYDRFSFTGLVAFSTGGNSFRENGVFKFIGKVKLGVLAESNGLNFGMSKRQYQKHRYKWLLFWPVFKTNVSVKLNRQSVESSNISRV